MLSLLKQSSNIQSKCNTYNQNKPIRKCTIKVKWLTQCKFNNYHNKNDCNNSSHSIPLSAFDNHLQLFLFVFLPLRVAKVLQKHFRQNIKCPKALCFQGFSGTCKPVDIIPTRWCRWAWGSGPSEHG